MKSFVVDHEYDTVVKINGVFPWEGRIILKCINMGRCLKYAAE